MHLPCCTHRLHSLAIVFLTSALFATAATAGVQINYLDQQTDATGHDTSPTLTVSILTGTATQSGILSGSGRLLKAGVGTLVLSGLNTYSNDTVVHGGTLAVVTGARMSQNPANIFIADVSGDSGTLLISGGTVGSNSGYIGTQTGSSGKVTITAGTWTNTSTLYLGNEGTGVLNLSGGTVSAYNSLVGNTAGSSGTANVSGGSWTSSGDLYLGQNGSAVLSITAGSVSNAAGIFGYSDTSTGAATVSGGTWTSSGELMIGYFGRGLLNITGGSVSSSAGTVGYYEGSTGVANVSGGTWTMNSDLVVGNEGTGILTITGGSVSDSSGLVANNNGSGIVTVSGGIWINSSDLHIGNYGSTGVLNLTGSGTVSVGPEGGGILNLAYGSGSTGILNLGTGGAAGTLNASRVAGNGNGDGVLAVVNFNHTGDYTFAPLLDGFMAVNQIGPGTTTLTAANTYSGVTSVLGGTLELKFDSVIRNILPSVTDIILGSGTLQLSGSGTQSASSISTRDNSAGSILMGRDETLAIGALNSVGQNSALNFDTAAGGGITLAGQTAGAVINPGFTVSDGTGFGLATVNAGDQVVRLTNAALLPASSALSTADYLINNGSGDATTAGSAQLQLNDSAIVHSITVDTTMAQGSLVLGENATLSTDVWNFGSASSETANSYFVAGGVLTSATAGGTLQINNYNLQPVFIASPIMDNDGMTLLFQGTGPTVLTGISTGLKDVKVTSGALVVTYGGGFSYTGTTTIGSQAGDSAILAIVNGSVQGSYGVIGDAAGAQGMVMLLGNGTWTQENGDLILGKSGTGVLNIGDGGVSQTQNGYLGVNAGSSGTVNLDKGGTWYLNRGLHIGQEGAGVVNLNGGTLTVGGENASGTVTLGAQGVLNIGTGAGTGTLQAGSITGASGAVVNFNYSIYSRVPEFNTPLAGDLSINKSGSGILVLTTPSTYTGGTTISSGILTLMLGYRTSDYLSPQSALTMGGGTFQVFGGGTQTMNGLSTLSGTGGYIHLSTNTTLNLGSLNSAGSASALNFDVSSGEADGSTVGTSIVTLSGQTPGVAINRGFTVIDSTGFGLATVNADSQVIRITDSDRLPHLGSDDRKDYLVDNSDTENDQPGSMRLLVSASVTARSITVDTTAAAGTLTLGSGAVLSSDVWNFGAYGAHSYEIRSDSESAGITTATPGGMHQINNYNGNSPVIISAPVLDNEGSGLRVAGTGLTFLNGSNTYTGETIVNSGTLYINGNESGATGDVIVQSAARLAGTGTLGGSLVVQNGGIVDPGNNQGAGTLSGTTATFATSSIFHVLGLNDSFTSLHLSGSITIAPGAVLSMDVIPSLTQSSYTLITAASGLDASTPFTLGDFTTLPEGYRLVYTGTALELDVIPPATAYWTGKVDSNWSSLSSGSTNWATAADGLTDTARLPDSPTDVTFSATGVGSTHTNLDVSLTINSLTVNSDTSITSETQQRLIVNTTTTVNALLVIGDYVKFVGMGDLTIGTEGALAGAGVQMERNNSVFVHGALKAGDQVTSAPQIMSINTSGTAALVMAEGSSLFVNLYSGAGYGDSSSLRAVGDRLSLYGTLDATAGGTIVIGNPHDMTAFAGGDKWTLIDLNKGRGSIIGHLAVNDSALGLTTGFSGSFDDTTGIYSIADHRPELTAESSGLPMANAESQAIISGSQTANNDVNNHLFNLRNGGGEEEEDGSITSALDYGVVVGQGDGPEDKNPIAKRVKRSRQWEVFTTVNYGNVRLSPINNQSGVQVDSWASSVGLERHLSRGLTLGLAATFLQSTQTYTGGLGKVDLEGPTLSTYLSYVRKNLWTSLLYSFGDYDMGTFRNPGFGLPTAFGSTRAYTHSVQFNTGYNFRFQNNTLVTGPFVGIDYLHGSVDAYTETGGGLGALAYARQTFESLVTRIGWSTSKKFDTTWATITPQFRVSYERQNLKNNGTSVQSLNAPFTAAGGNQIPGQDYMVLGTGVNFQFTSDFSMQLGYQVQLFRNNMEAHFGSVRFGYKF